MESALVSLLKGTSLYLVGMPGSGKSTLGQTLAMQLGYRFFDTDQLIESAVGQRTTQIFEESGEAVFRELETRTLAELAPMARMVVATGGGIVLRPENWSHLRNGVVLWLDPPLSVIGSRLAGDRSRPLLAGDLAAKLTELRKARSPLYQQADLRLEIGVADSLSQCCDRATALLTAACREKAAADALILEQNRSAPFQAN
jgi:shikimate kinase